MPRNTTTTHALLAGFVILAALGLWFRPAFDLLPTVQTLAWQEADAGALREALFAAWPADSAAWRPLAVGANALYNAFLPAHGPLRMALHLLTYALCGWLLGLLLCRRVAAARPWAFWLGGLWLLVPLHHPLLYDPGPGGAHLLSALCLLAALLLHSSDSDGLPRRLSVGGLAALSLMASELGLWLLPLGLGLGLHRAFHPGACGPLSGRLAAGLRHGAPLWLPVGLILPVRGLALGGVGPAGLDGVALLAPATGLACFLLAHILPRLDRRVLAVPLWAGLAIALLAGAFQLRQSAEDWRRAGELVAGLRDGFANLPPALDALPLNIHDVPARIGRAPGLSDFPPRLTGRSPQAPPVLAAGMLDERVFREILVESPQAPPRLVWRQGRLMRLDGVPGVPAGLGIELHDCTGPVDIAELRIVSAQGVEQRITDFRRWEINGGGRLHDSGKLEIDTPPLAVFAPPNRAPRLDRVASIHLTLERPPGLGACLVLLTTDDPRSPASMSRRALGRRFSGSVSWRLSGLDPALRSFWRHLVLRDMHHPRRIREALTPPENSRLAHGEFHLVEFAAAYVERVRIHLEGLSRRDDSRPLVGVAELWGRAEGETAFRLLAERLSLSGASTESLGVSLARDLPPLAALVLVLDTERIGAGGVQLELDHPLRWPLLMVDESD